MRWKLRAKRCGYGRLLCRQGTKTSQTLRSVFVTCSRLTRPWVMMMMVVMMTMMMTMMMKVSRSCLALGQGGARRTGGRGRGNCTAARACAECYNNKVGDEVGARR